MAFTTVRNDTLGLVNIGKVRIIPGASAPVDADAPGLQKLIDKGVVTKLSKAEAKAAATSTTNDASDTSTSTIGTGE